MGMVLQYMCGNQQLGNWLNTIPGFEGFCEDILQVENGRTEQSMRRAERLTPLKSVSRSARLHSHCCLHNCYISNNSYSTTAHSQMILLNTIGFALRHNES